jgi:hypothetical protein
VAKFLEELASGQLDHLGMQLHEGQKKGVGFEQPIVEAEQHHLFSSDLRTHTIAK